MSRFSTEQKLELSQYIRQEQALNREQMQRREAILYGTSGSLKKDKNRTPEISAAQEQGDLEQQDKEWKEQMRKRRISFMIRMFLALMLFLCVLLMKYQNLVIEGITYDGVIESLQNQDFINGIDFESLFTYTES